MIFGLVVRRNRNSFTIPTTANAIFGVDDAISQYTGLPINERKKRWMNEVKDLLIGAWMPVLVIIRHLLEGSYGFEERQPKFLGNDGI